MTPRISQFATFIIVTSLASPPQSQYALDFALECPRYRQCDQKCRAMAHRGKAPVARSFAVEWVRRSGGETENKDRETDMAAPIKISHIVLQTNDPKALQAWYCTVLDGEMVHDAGVISFMSYDDEHHRVAFITPGALEKRQPGEDGPHDFRAGRETGLHHIAFTLKDLGD